MEVMQERIREKGKIYIQRDLSKYIIMVEIMAWHDKWAKTGLFCHDCWGRGHSQGDDWDSAIQLKKKRRMKTIANVVVTML